MSVKHKYLYLFLALACFVGIILIFVFDGYMGVYDHLSIDNGQYVQTVESDQWRQTDRFSGIYSTGIGRGGRVDFTYTIENHRFSAYNEDVVVSLWYNKEKTTDILSTKVTIPSFDKEVLAWTLTVDSIVPPDYPTEQNYIVNVKINRGNIEREINLVINATPTIIKSVPIPAP